MRTHCSAAALVLGTGLAGCYLDDRPRPLVLCHNSNCTEPHDVSNDDTIGALRDSLALVGADDVPVIDGIELDLFRHRGECLFAHDVGNLAGHVDIRDGATVVADHLMTRSRVSHNGSQFNVKLELKPLVDGSGDLDEQITCAFDVYDILRQAAIASGHPIELVFDSYNPATLRAVHPRRPPDEDMIWTRLSIDYGVPPPLRADNYDLDKLDVPVDIAEIHDSWITDTALRALRSYEVDLSVWSFDLTRETLDSLDNLDPRYALTGQALTLRAWLDR